MSEQKKEMETDSTTEELEEETSAVVDPKYKRFALANVIGGYAAAVAVIALVVVNTPEVENDTTAGETDSTEVTEGTIGAGIQLKDNHGQVLDLGEEDEYRVAVGRRYVDPGFVAKDKDGKKMKVEVTGDDFDTFEVTGEFPHIVEYLATDSEGNEYTATRMVHVVDANVAVRSDEVRDVTAPTVVLGEEPAILNPRDHIGGGGLVNNVNGPVEGNVGYRGGSVHGGGGNHGGVGHDGIGNVDVGAFDREVAAVNQPVVGIDDDVNVVTEREFGLGGKGTQDVEGFELKRNRPAGDLTAVDGGDLADGGDGAGPGYAEKGELYAYNTPSLGVGAGVGAPAVGAGVGAAGIGAGIGQASMEGKPVPALGGIGSYVPPAGSAPAGPDGDNDGLPDALEQQYGTDSQKTDTDSDGYSDAAEVKALSNPKNPLSIPKRTAPSTEPDSDNDGLPASIEKAYGTSPTKDDTDGDGFSDSQEISAMTNPTDPKSNPGSPGVGGPAMAGGPGAAGGVGGLVSGAGAGGAAGLVTGMVKQPLGLGIGCESCGDKGCGDCADKHPAGCGCGHHGHGVGHGGEDFDRWDELPPDGNLYIMMHVDGSGSILDTRKALEEMQKTIMKNALLPYYLNDENLYNSRVKVVDGKGERTLQFFADATQKDNVLAFVFQDEAQPVYHLPFFNKEPEDKYLEDLNRLKSGLGGYGGLYRGVMLQVDRGRTFTKTFKEFVECAWRGEGFLASNGSNLKKYYWQENRHHIKNHDGVVFSDVYHVKDKETPQYYMNLIFEASRKVGIDLQKYGGGLEDGNYNSKTQQD